MIYLLGNEKYFVNWLPGYAENLCKGFREMGVAFTFIMDLEDIAFYPTDSLIVIDYVDLPRAISLKKKLGKKCPILISHSHGTSAFILGCKAKGDQVKEEEELREMDIVTCNTYFHTSVMKEVMGVNAVFTGYPMDFEKIERFGKGVEKESGKIVVGGRVEQDRQLFIAVESLLSYGKFVTFCVPHSKEWADELWGEDSIDRFEKVFNFIWSCPQKKFYEELASAEVVATFGCVDTLNLSILEGITLGCYPVAPSKLPYLEYMSEGYEPYSIKDIRRRIENQPKISFCIDTYSYQRVAKRYTQEIWKKVSQRRGGLYE